MSCTAFYKLFLGMRDSSETGVNVYNCSNFTLNRFSSGASKWQVEFFKHKPNQVSYTQFWPASYILSHQVKELIRRAKAWRNIRWKGVREGKPKSFLMSVIVLSAYERAEKKTLGDTTIDRIAWQ